MTLIALCVLLCMVGHIVRDGWPPTNSTQLARFLGAFWCYFGAVAVHSTQWAAALAGAVWLGFYTDMKHGEGQGAGAWRDVPYLLLSGVTSLVPLAILASWYHGWHYALILLAGIAKPPIWFAWWRARPDRFWSWCYPTRAAAITFGAVVGALLALL